MENNSESKTPEFEPPQACVNRVIKAALPDNIQITKEARAAFARAAGVFIFYLTHCANDFCKDNKRQTIYTSDVMSALRELDLESFEGPLQEFLEEYRREEMTKKTKGRKSDGAEGNDEDDEDEMETVNPASATSPLTTTNTLTTTTTTIPQTEES